MQKIIPFLWFDGNSIEAMNFYTSIFQNSKIMSIIHYGKAGPEPEGKVMSATFKIAGQQFTALNGGPDFIFSPAISFFVNCETPEEIDELWENLSDGGTVLIELGKYPISEKFGWIQDKFGVSWQLNLSKIIQKISPFLMFVREQTGKAEEAIDFYMSLFKNSEIIEIIHYGPGEDETEGTVKRARFLLNGQEFMAIDSNREHEFTFTPAISFFVNCQTQEEIDILWDKLSEGGEKLKMGWLTDKYGVSWQIIPAVLGEMLEDMDHAKSNRVMEAMITMDKMDIDKLKEAYGR